MILRHMVRLQPDGSVEFDPSFHQQNIDERLLQLADWLDDLQILYEAALAEKYGTTMFPFKQVRKVYE